MNFDGIFDCGMNGLVQIEMSGVDVRACVYVLLMMFHMSERVAFEETSVRRQVDLIEAHTTIKWLLTEPCLRKTGFMLTPCFWALISGKVTSSCVNSLVGNKSPRSTNTRIPVTIISFCCANNTFVVNEIRY